MSLNERLCAALQRPCSFDCLRGYQPAARGGSQTNAAQALGVSREHLNRVLNGRRTSRRLLARWNELKGAVA